jgi:hypothetical protein
MVLIVALTGAGGFLCSFILFRVGVVSLALRYGLSVACAYLIFLFLLWCWLNVRDADWADSLDWPSGNQKKGSDEFPKSPDCNNAPGPSSGIEALDIDLGELGILLLIVAAFVAATGTSFWIIVEAPTFLAELLLDVALAAGLYRRIKNIEQHHWLETAVKKTVGPFFIVGCLFVIVGALIQHQMPEAHSIGDFVRRHNPHG